MRFRASFTALLLAGCSAIELDVAADREGATEGESADIFDDDQAICEPESACACEGTMCQCAEDEDCWITCGANCDLLCQQSGSCDFTCGAGSTVDCKNQSDCTVTCEHDCTVKCTNAGSCDITCGNPSLPLTSCNGNTQACGPCP